MTDSESVMQALKDSLRNQHCGFIENVGNVYAVSEETIKDILELLKEQEPVKPIERSGFWYCGNCRYALMMNHQKFCSDCGQAVKFGDKE